jgi:hypothetical protein
VVAPGSAGTPPEEITTMNTNTHRIRTAAVFTTACAAVIVTAPAAVAIPQGDGADPGPTQQAFRSTTLEPEVIPAVAAASHDRPCFIWHNTWNTAEGPEPTCPAQDTTTPVTAVPRIADPGCIGVTNVQYRHATASSETTGCAPTGHWWDFIPA